MSYADPRASEIRRHLVSRVNGDGGWGYYPQRESRLEPTCWALRGLLSAGGLGVAPRDAARALFRQWQEESGLLVESAVRGGHRPNVAFNALAAWLLLDERTLAPDGTKEALIAALVRARGLQVTESTINRQDSAIEGWSWIDGSFSWVEPTCWALIALRQANSSAAIARRIAEGERLLVDRCCPSGGWNYGNGNMLGQDLRPYVPTTALGLIAMKPRAGEASVRRSLDYLRAHRLSVASAMALSLAIVALRTYGEDASDVEAALLEQWERTRFLGNAHLMGLALYSLGLEAGGGA